MEVEVIARFARFALAAVLGLSVIAPKPAAADGAASTRNIIFGAAALPEPERDWLAAAEQLPIESLWQGGHLLPPTGTGEAITRLALLTAWTERVRIGTSILLLPLYQPVLVAKQLAESESRTNPVSTQPCAG